MIFPFTQRPAFSPSIFVIVPQSSSLVAIEICGAKKETKREFQFLQEKENFTVHRISWWIMRGSKWIEWGNLNLPDFHWQLMRWMRRRKGKQDKERRMFSESLWETKNEGRWVERERKIQSGPTPSNKNWKERIFFSPLTSNIRRGRIVTRQRDLKWLIPCWRVLINSCMHVKGHKEKRAVLTTCIWITLTHGHWRIFHMCIYLCPFFALPFFVSFWRFETRLQISWSFLYTRFHVFLSLSFSSHRIHHWS